MKHFTVFASSLLLAVSLSVAQTPARHGWLRVQGSQVLNEQGKPVQLRGMSYFWSMAGESRDYYNAGVVNYLADDWKINVIRAAMGVDENWGASSTGYLACSPAGSTTNCDKSGTVSNKQRVFDVVDAAIAKGIYAIIDWHSHSAHQNTDQAKAFFTEMAEKYKTVPNVIYEIYNEPTAGCGTQAVATSAWNTIKPYLQTVTNAIREVDPNNLIIIGTPCYSQRVDIAANDSIVGKNLLYALHFYSNNPDHTTPLRANATAALSKNKAVFVSEFGTCNSNGGTKCADGTNNPNCTQKVNDNSHNAAETDIWLNFLDENKISWVNWSISTKDEAASAIKAGTSTSGNWTESNFTPSGAYIRGKLIDAQTREDAMTAVLTPARSIPNSQQTTESASIAPAAALSNHFSVGPVPASQFDGGVKFFWQGKTVNSGSLQIYNALGNSVKSIGINSESSVGSLSRRAIGGWDLTDAKGRRVTAGSYLVKGKIVTQSGNAAIVSSIIVVSN